MPHKFSFIGTGSMGSALARAVVRTVPPEEVLLSNRTPAKAETLAEELNCTAVSVREAARDGQYIVLGVKPQMMPGLLSEIAPVLASREDRFILVTMAAGLTMVRITEMAGGAYPVIRIMPNTPCAVGEGMVPCCANPFVNEPELAEFIKSMSKAGTIDRLEERLIDAGCAVSGCGPAYVSLMIEALADGGTACGLTRQKALLYAAQAVKGAAALQLASGMHPGAMKDAVCSPGGAAIAGVRVLEEHGFRGAAMGAVIAAIEKTKELGK